MGFGRIQRIRALDESARLHLSPFWLITRPIDVESDRKLMESTIERKGNDILMDDSHSILSLSEVEQMLVIIDLTTS